MTLSGDMTINVSGDFDELSKSVEGLRKNMTVLFELEAALKVAAGRENSDEPSSIQVYGVTVTPNDE